MHRRTRRTLCAIGLCSAIAVMPSVSSGSHAFAFLPERAASSAQHGLEASAGQSRRAAVAAIAPAIMLSSAQAAHAEKTQFKRIQTQFIAALGDPTASSGTGAESWGVWKKDPGPRGVDLGSIERVKAGGGVTRAGWKFDDADWYVEEHGLIMEKPSGGDGGSGEPLRPGKYLVTGDREITTILTVSPPGEDGSQRWELEKGKLYDVTHLPCRTGRYTGPACTPAKARQSDFPVTPGGLMPPVEGCNKQDYAVLFVIGVAV